MATAPHFISKMPSIASIRASVLDVLVQQLDKKTGKADILLASHGMLRSQLADPYAVVPMARYIALFEEAAVLIGEPAFGARMGTLFKPADIGPIGMLFSLSPTIKRAFERMSKYVTSVQGATSSGLFEENGELVWNYGLIDPGMWPRRQDSEYSLAASCELVRSCFTSSWKPLEVHFEHQAPRDASPLRKIFRAPVLFGQSGNRLVIAKKDADRIYRQEDRNLTAILERHIADLIEEADFEPDLRQKVRALIAIYLGHKPITLDAISRELGVSSRTLQRRLTEEGTSLRALVRDHRQAIVRLHLSSDVKKAQIANALGYADSTVLWRAQRAWSRVGED